jgi:hypothetical protein
MTSVDQRERRGWSGRVETGEPPRAATVEIVIPVRDEERGLAPAVRSLHTYLGDAQPVSCQITIADNGSTDGTWPQALALERELPGVRAVRIEPAGRAARCGRSGQRATPGSWPTWTWTCPPT